MSVSSSTMGGGRTKYKFILLGDQSVGKSSIIQKYIKDKFQDGSNPTVGIDFHVKNVTRNSKHYRIQLWDTAGQQRFRSLIPNYMKDAHCAILVYDCTRPVSLQNLKIWNQMFQNNKSLDAIKVCIGNKSDLQQKCISKKQGQQQSIQYDAKHFEVSAKTGKHIDLLFNSIIDQIGKKLQEKTKLPIVNDEQEQKDDKKQKKQIKNQKPAVQKIVLKKQVATQINEIKKKKQGCC